MGEQAQFGAAGLAVATELFNAWQQFQHDDNHARLRRRIKPLQAKLRAELEHASRKSARTRYHRQFARNLLKRWPALWTFIHTDGVEPTNNHAERGLRGAVIYRKLSLGSQSEPGEQRSNDCSPPQSPAASASNPSSPTSPKSSPHTPPATQYPDSPDRRKD